MIRSMSMRRALGVVLAFAAPLILRAQQTGRPVFRAASDAVLVDAVVTDGKSSVPNLKPADFELLDNGVRQTITDLDYGRLPLDVRVLFDTSVSVNNAQLEKFAHAIGQVGAALKSGDRCEAWSFGRREFEVAPLGEPPLEVKLTRESSDGTAFFDDVALAMITTPRPGRRQLTIVLSDGQDTSSFYDQSALIRAAQHTDAVVYSVVPPGAMPVVSSGSTTRVVTTSGTTSRVVIPPSMTASLAGPSARVLDTLARTTGGRVLTLDAKGDLAASFLKAIDEFRQSYVLKYMPEGVESKGWHELTVTVKGKKYTVRAKQGYEGGK